MTVDGQPFAARGQVLFVALIDAAHLDEAKATKLPKLYTGCKPDGTFSFHTYVQGDGVPVGKYVAVFVALHRRTAHTRGTSMLTGPDELKNLYNDPDKNAKIATFQVDAQPPGRDDYDFDLSIAGKDAVTAPGPNALTVIQRL